MTNEARYLLHLARGDFAAGVPPPTLVLHERTLIRQAQYHQIAALCFHQFKVAAEIQEMAPVPGLAGALRRFQMEYLFHHRRNEALQGDIRSIVEAMEGSGVGVLFFKGPWLAFCAYPEPGTRPVRDLDLGIVEHDYTGAVAGLRKLGYLPLGTIPRLGVDAIRAAHYGGQLRFRAEGRVPVELHFRLVNVGPPSPEEAWVWETSRRVDLGGTAVRVPGPEAMLLHLLLHANQHAFTRLRLLHDIRFALVRTGAALEIGLLEDQVERLRCRATAYFGLLLARDLAAAPVPDPLLARFRPGGIRRQIFKTIWQLPRVRRLDLEGWNERWEASRFYLAEMGAWRDKLRFLRGIVRQSGGLLAFLRQMGESGHPQDT